jgi:ergothioneine biosynthesis protein EgtB
MATAKERTSNRADLLAAFQRVRAATERLAAPLSAEDQGLQSMPACSPAKWHRAHTTWFFETFLLAPRGAPLMRPEWGPLFNSYYVAAGPRGARPKRGMLSRPSAAEVGEYRRVVDARVVSALEAAGDGELAALEEIVLLGLAHEEQHQELLLTDILHAFSENPLRPRYRELAAPQSPSPARRAAASPLAYDAFDGGVREIGAAPGLPFFFDNEEPRHKTFVEPFALARRLVTVGEWKGFADAGGYETASLWLSEGFDWACAAGVRAPLYCARDGGALVAFGFGGTRALGDDEPVTHLSFYEADALARFMDARLPTEAEWELAAGAARRDPAVGNFLEDDRFRPLAAAAAGDGISQLFGDAWEWTSSAYAPYPGFRPRAGAVGEYNGKFMVNQIVLRGGSCLTPRGHVRASYRNFWHPDTRFQMSGVRLARTVTR